MKAFELIGGPLDGAIAEGEKGLEEGDHIVVDPEENARAVYTLHNGLLEYDVDLTFDANSE